MNQYDQQPSNNNGDTAQDGGYQFNFGNNGGQLFDATVVLRPGSDFFELIFEFRKKGIPILKED